MPDRDEGRPTEDLGDAVVFGGVLGLLVGLATHTEWVSILAGMTCGAIVDSVGEYRRVKACARAAERQHEG